ncbi:Ni/Fe-hydrogenase, b-type cytochrome subunit [Hydrogenophilus islandicus]
MLANEDQLEIERRGRQVKSVYVYEAPVRLWHWINAAAIVVLATTGYFIGLPLPSVPGEAATNFLMGYVRFAHFAAGYVFAIGLLGRIYWAFVGNHHARQLFILPVWKREWWREVGYELRWYLFLERQPKKYVGHNPLAQLAMFFLFFLLALFMITTGFALYSEGAGQGHWSDTLFGWVIPAFGGSLQVHMLHRTGMWLMVIFVMVHVYAAIREDIMSRQSLISTMVSGWRMYKE